MKLLKIAWKDFKITYRDISALMLMIAAPLAMTLVMAFAFSGSSDSGFSTIPVGLVNLDQDGTAGTLFVNALSSQEVKEYILPLEFETEEEAREQLDTDKLGAVIIIPAEASLLFETENQDYQRIDEDFPVEIRLITNSTRPISGMIVEAVLDSILTQLNAGFVGGMMGFGELINQGIVTTDELTDGLGIEIGEKLEPLFAENESNIAIETQYLQSEREEFNWLTYMAPSMAILYLGFSMTTSARSILSEREGGTLSRLLTSPTKPGVLIAGKMLGTFMIGLIQVFTFILASIPLLGVQWGNPWTIMIFTCSIVLASASWGIFVASIAKNSGQASALGMAINLVFAAVAGNFVPRQNYPEWLKQIGYLTPNAWGIEGYLNLLNQGTLADISTNIIALVGMAAFLLLMASISFTFQYGQIGKTGGKNE
jgi:ABC-2 type transport system permease protein